jgi:hypothetical protein
MPGTLIPDQDFDHLLLPVSGFDGMHDLQLAGEVADSQSWNRGALVSLNSNGKLKAGCGDQDMPLFAINATGDFDVASDEGNIAGGNVGTYPAIGGFEFKTTEYELDQVYLPNDFLTAGLGDELGRVTKSPTAYNDRIICGQVSKGTDKDVYGQDVLFFWGLNIPALRASSLDPSPASSSSSSSS